jgi:Conserved TM helix
MTGTVQTVTSWGDAIFLALSGALNDVLGFVPKLLGALVILLVGWLIAKAVEALVSKGLRAVRFNQVADRAELDQFLDKAGVRLDPSAVVGKLAYWFLFLIFIGAAFNTFGLTQVNIVINQIIAYLPSVVVALVVLLVGALLATFVGNLVRGASGSARVGDPGLLATLARTAVLGFAVIIALNQLQIGAAIVNTLFMALVGGVALAAALAFGLGGREVAGRLVEDWYARRGAVADTAGRLADAAQRESAAAPSGNGASRPPAPASPTYTVSPSPERRGA